MTIHGVNIDNIYTFSDFEVVKNSEEFRTLLRLGIIEKHTRAIPGNEQDFKPNNIVIQQTISQIPINVCRLVTIDNKKIVTVYVLNLNVLIKCYRLDGLEIVSAVYSMIKQDIVGMLIAIFGMCKNIVKAGKVNITQDVALLHAYFSIKLSGKKLNKSAFHEAYKQFPDDVPIDSISVISPFESIFESMIKSNLLIKQNDGTYKLSKTIGLLQEKSTIKRNLKNQC